MKAKHISSILVIALIFQALCASAQAVGPKLVFEAPEWDFGTVGEADGPVTHCFEARNEGDAPEVILEAVSGCGCTKPRFSRQPVRPGERTTVEVSFHPAGQSGAVSKRVTLFGSRGQVVARLLIRGQVTPRPRTVAERFPVEVGGGVRLTNNFLPFGTIPQGRVVETAVGVVNDAAAPRRIRWVPRTPGGWLTLSAPESLAPGEEGEVRVRFLVPAGSDGYGTVEEIFDIEVDGVRQPALFTCCSTVVDAPLQQPERPEAHLEPPVVRFGDVSRRRGSRAEASAELANRGDAPLHVRAVELPDGVTCTLAAGDTVAPGAAKRIGLTLLGDRFEPGVMAEKVLIVVNDPARPVWQLRLSAVVR